MTQNKNKRKARYNLPFVNVMKPFQQSAFILLPTLIVGAALGAPAFRAGAGRTRGGARV